MGKLETSIQHMIGWVRIKQRETDRGGVQNKKVKWVGMADERERARQREGMVYV